MNYNRKIKVKNKRTDDELILNLDEFKDKFADELECAIQSFSKNEISHNLHRSFISNNEDYELDFYLDLQWNFNNLSNSVWYIEDFI